MTKLYSVAEILSATGGRAQAVEARAVDGISIDSRDIAPGALFVAIRGERHDGHDFVDTALAAGAGAALVSEGRAEPQARGLIVVSDPLQGLVDLARTARARSAASIVAVTGSAGKTTTKEAIRTVLGAAGPTHFSIKSFNNHWGVPLMLARMPREAAFGVFEIGMNHAGEITPLTRLVRPHVAVVTTVAAAHLEFFDSVADIARAKAEIFLGLEPGGVAVINTDHEHVSILRDAAAAAGAGRIITYGSHEDAEWQIADAASTGEGSRATIRHHGELLTLAIGARGRHMVANALAALVVAEAFGIPRQQALASLAGFGAPEGRGANLRLGPVERPLVLVDESYNANGASMAAALEAFAEQAPEGGRKILVLGDMRELGAQSASLHRALKGAVEASGADRVFLVGQHMGALAEALAPERVAGHAQRVEEIADAVLDGLAYGDAVMVKGSNGVGLGSLVKKIRDRFA